MLQFLLANRKPSGRSFKALITAALLELFGSVLTSWLTMRRANSRKIASSRASNATRAKVYLRPVRSDIFGTQCTRFAGSGRNTNTVR